MKTDKILEILDNLGRGKKAHQPSSLDQEAYEKYDHYVKSKAKKDPAPPSLRDMLLTASGKKTQAIFKISSYGKGKKKITNHMRYISRNGKLNLENQDGRLLKTLKEQRDVLKTWEIDFGGARSRDTMHLVLSTPPGTDRENAREAAKEFLQKEYANHDYVFVAHKDTDHPHVHAVIKMVSHEGRKLNPRKCYLHAARKRYAEICREKGIQVEASSRAERGLPGKSEPAFFKHIRKRTNRRPLAESRIIQKVFLERQKKTSEAHPSGLKMMRRNQIIRKRYADKAKALKKKSGEFNDQKERERYISAAKTLDRYAKKLPIEITRGDKVLVYFARKEGKLTQEDFRKYQTDEARYQYRAVTLGLRNKNGIYVSPDAFLKKAKSPSLHKGLEKECDIDID